MRASTVAVLTGCLLALPGRAASQDSAGTPAAARAASRPVTWCASPAPDPEWGRQIAYFTFDQWGRDGRRLTPVQSGILLEAIVRAYVADTARLQAFPGRAGGTVKAPVASPLDTLPPGEPRYGPRALESFVALTLRGDGRIDSLRSFGGDSTLNRDLERAIRTAEAAGALGPVAPAADRLDLELSIRTSRAARGAQWPAFTVEAPLSRPVRPRKGNVTPMYPRGLKRWRASLRLFFVVDSTGRVQPGSARPMVTADSLRRAGATPEEARVYTEFVRAVLAASPHWRFEPAEVLGCRVNMPTVQQFTFVTVP